MTKFDESRYIVKAKIKKEYCGNIAERWVQGCLVIANDRNDDIRYRIQPTAGHHRFAFPIDPETICKPTGQKDKNNCLIFEHDLCIVENFGIDLFEVLWDNKTSQYILKRDDISLDFGSTYGNQCEVVGNVFDKQEIQKDAERTLFVGDKSKEEIVDWLKANAKLGTAYATFEDGSKATILMFQNGQTADIYFPDWVRTTGATLDEVAEELVKVSLTKEVEKEMENER